jgi:tRNA uracil 4-sulfurtransferase
MDSLYLIKPGEMELKTGNRREFEAQLRRDIERRMHGFVKVDIRPGRFFLHVPEERTLEAEEVLSRVPGLVGFARALQCQKNLTDIAEAAVKVARECKATGKSTFKIEARRSDKSFPLDSYGIARELGARILEEVPGLTVDVHNPEFTVSAEVRERAYVYGAVQQGLKGLPIGSAGKGLLLLSGGIDSPVAGYMMAKRGLALEAVYYNAYPYTSQEAWEKVRDLSRVVGRYSGGTVLHTISFTEIQTAIKRGSPENYTTLFLRAAMVRAAHLLAVEIGANSLVTGESLGQVASQTSENIRLAQSLTDLPVFRPLIGIDKEDTIRTARQIGSYEISILPYEDCCVLFSPEHPILKAKLDRDRESYEALGLEPLIQESIKKREIIALPYGS